MDECLLYFHAHNSSNSLEELDLSATARTVWGGGGGVGLNIFERIYNQHLNHVRLLCNVCNSCVMTTMYYHLNSQNWRSMTSTRLRSWEGRPGSHPSRRRSRRCSRKIAAPHSTRTRRWPGGVPSRWELKLLLISLQKCWSLASGRVE